MDKQSPPPQVGLTLHSSCKPQKNKSLEGNPTIWSGGSLVPQLPSGIIWIKCILKRNLLENPQEPPGDSRRIELGASSIYHKSIVSVGARSRH